MPELPEVQTIVNDLQPLAGATIQRAALLRNDILTPADCDFCRRVRQQRILAIFRRAKRIVFALEDGNYFYIHLGMTGRLSLCRAHAPLHKHTHLVFDFGPRQLHFTDPRRFGGVFWLADQLDESALGPEPLLITPRQLAQRLAGTRRCIKAALLDQKLIAGLGNIYVDESLHAAKIAPHTPAALLRPQQVGLLCRSIKTILRRALNHRGSTFSDYRGGNGSPGEFQRFHRVYGRGGLPCHRCGGLLVKITLAGRGTHYCPQCQS